MRPAKSFVGQPIRSLQTMLRVIAEYDGSIPSVVPDGIYGKETVTSVTEFQRAAGLPATGVTDQMTWEQIVAVYDEAIVSVGPAQQIEIVWDPNKMFLPGDESAYIYLAQSMLLYLSDMHDAITKPSVNGRLDGETSRSISSFQVLSDLPPTGSLDKKTWKHLTKQFTLHANARSMANN